MIEQLRGYGFPELEPITDGKPRPFWSIVIPTNNRLTFLDKAIRSVVDQLDTENESVAEVLIVDSSDADHVRGTVTDIHGAEFHPMPDNLGAIRNWNRAIGLTRGYWVHLLHDDDYVLPGFFKRLRAGIEATSAGAVCTGYENINGEGKVTFTQRFGAAAGVLDREAWLRTIGTGNVLQPPAVVIARSTYEQIGLYDSRIPYCADWELYKRAASFVQWFHEPALLARYRQHDQSGTLGADLVNKYCDLRHAIETSYLYFPVLLRDEVSTAARKQALLMAWHDAGNVLNAGDIKKASLIIAEAANLLRKMPMSRFGDAYKKYLKEKWLRESKDDAAKMIHK